MQHIETVTVGAGGAASITFSAIPDTFTDLYLVVSARSNRSSAFIDYLALEFNGNTSNYSGIILRGTGSAVASVTGASLGLNNFIGFVPASSSTSDTFGSVSIYVPNYRSASAKSASADHVNETNGTTSYHGITAFLWNDTTAITSVTLRLLAGGTNSFVEHSSASLYGILAGSDGVTSVS